jgi:hypothetical protein
MLRTAETETVSTECLPDDIINVIQSFLDPLALTCLWLTAKRFKDLMERTRHTMPRTESEIAKEVIMHGGVNLFEWFHDLGGRLFYPRAYSLAAFVGNTGFFDWLDGKKVDWRVATDLMDDAMRRGSVEMLKYLRALGFTWHDDHARSAAMFGHLDALRYAHEAGCPWDGRVCRMAVASDSLDVLKYARENDCPCPWNVDVSGDAVALSGIDMLRYVHEHGCPWNSLVWWTAICKGNVDALKYAHVNGCPPLSEEQIVCVVTHTRSSACVDYLREVGLYI